MNPIVQKIKNRIHDAPLETERLLDDAAEEIERLEERIEVLELLLSVSDESY